MADDSPFVTGALVLLDALAFKGIWQMHDPREVLAAMERLEAVASGQIDVIDRYE